MTRRLLLLALVAGSLAGCASGPDPNPDYNPDKCALWEAIGEQERLHYGGSTGETDDVIEQYCEP